MASATWRVSWSSYSARPVMVSEILRILSYALALNSIFAMAYSSIFIEASESSTCFSKSLRIIPELLRVEEF